MMGEYKTWPELLEWVRKHIRTTPKARVAAAIGISRQTLDTWLNEPGAQPTEASLQKLANAFGRGIDDPLHMRTVRVSRPDGVPDHAWEDMKRAMARWRRRAGYHVLGMLDAEDHGQLDHHHEGAQRAMVKLAELARQRLSLVRSARQVRP